MTVGNGMPNDIDVHSFFDAIIKQDAAKLRSFFVPDATVIWANTNEQFTVEEYIRANCEYPGRWNGHIEDIKCYTSPYDRNRITIVAKVWDENKNASRVVSFIELNGTKNQLIQSMVEYWGEISKPPKWRQEMGVGKRYHDES